MLNIEYILLYITETGQCALLYRGYKLKPIYIERENVMSGEAIQFPRSSSSTTQCLLLVLSYPTGKQNVTIYA